ncbi:MAG: LysM peptidoglycan-binding domain-containing protein [Candidatus Acidiferrales bacterium]
MGAGALAFLLPPFLAVSLGLAGCDDTSKKQVKVRPPAATPVAAAPEIVREPLPYTEPPTDYSAIQTPVRPSIDVLVEKVEAAYNTGQKELKAGDFEKARAEFDRAVDLIQSSGFQVQSDSRLSKLFDEIGDATQSYEQAQAQNNAEEEEENPGIPAPIEEIADLTLPQGDPRLYAKAEQELIAVPHDLPLTVNESVLQYLSYFTTVRGRAIVEHGLERAGRYNEMIRRTLKSEGVPQDLIYLAQAESAFLPQAVSRAGARGIWQFMPYRGEEYGLDRTYWIDERSDPEKATHAAAQHMKDLYAMFGDWYLVMAAYNSGPGNVAKAIQRTGYADFWELQKRHALPKQTQNYVPIIIALALVAKDPMLYGVQIQPEKPPAADTVRPGHPVDLHLVADATGADLDDLRLLNPSLLRSSTPNDPQFVLSLPKGTAAKFEDNIQRVPTEKWTSWRLHSVESGETLAEIARHYRVTVPSIENANHLEAHAVLPAGFLLNVPTAPPVVKLVHYRVQRGDTLEGIAARFEVTVAELRRWNHISGAKAPRGARLRIYAGGEPVAASHAKSKSAGSGAPAARGSAAVENVSSAPAAKSDPVQHRVKKGETLYSIARAYRTTVTALRNSNPFLADRPLAAGDVLTIQR